VWAYLAVADEGRQDQKPPKTTGQGGTGRDK
jgi:hypothetical protein